MANSIIGTHGSIGPVVPTPIRLADQPHWKTATITPYAAPIDSRFMITAFSGTSSAAEHDHQQQERRAAAPRR